MCTCLHVFVKKFFQRVSDNIGSLFIPPTGSLHGWWTVIFQNTPPPHPPTYRQVRKWISRCLIFWISSFLPCAKIRKPENWKFLIRWGCIQPVCASKSGLIFWAGLITCDCMALGCQHLSIPQPQAQKHGQQNPVRSSVFQSPPNFGGCYVVQSCSTGFFSVSSVLMFEMFACMHVYEAESLSFNSTPRSCIHGHIEELDEWSSIL